MAPEAADAGLISLMTWLNMQSFNLLAFKLWICIAPLRKYRQICGLEKYIYIDSELLEEKKMNVWVLTHCGSLLCILLNQKNMKSRKRKEEHKREKTNEVMLSWKKSSFLDYFSSWKCFLKRHHAIFFPFFYVSDEKKNSCKLAAQMESKIFRGGAARFHFATQWVGNYSK